MNKVQEKALDSYAREINKAVDTKQAIIETVNFDEEYERAKEKEIQREEERTEEKSFEFNPKEIQTLVDRGDDFRKRIQYKPGPLETSKKEQVNKKEENERGI